jgi:hypothetical protein
MHPLAVPGIHPLLRMIALGILLACPLEFVYAQGETAPSGARISPHVAFELRYGLLYGNEDARVGGHRAPLAESSPTIGRDKVLHVAISAAWTGAAYYGLDRSTNWPPARTIGVAAGSAAVLGAGKEVRDATTPTGDASGADLLANALGIGVAVGVIAGMR